MAQQRRIVLTTIVLAAVVLVSAVAVRGFTGPSSSFDGGVGVWLLGSWWYVVVLALWGVVWLLLLVLGCLALALAWRRVAVVLVAGVLILGAAAWSWPGISLRIGLVRGDQDWFAQHRSDFDEAARTTLAGCCADASSGALLPEGQRYLSVNGRVFAPSEANPEALFFPQWAGMPDDAGGYWYSPQDSPAGQEMFGMTCRAPGDLGGGWWRCGM